MIFRLVFIFFLFSVSVFSQENYIKHTISKGENITVIAKKYGLKPKDITEANPDAPKILKLNSVLLIPNTNQSSISKSNEPVTNPTPGLHEVLAKETLWGISKQYKISIEDLKQANPFLETEGLKIGQKINIPSNIVVTGPATAHAEASNVEIIREVQPKETKYSIAKEFGITVAELEMQNPEVKTKLPIGYKLKILTSKEKAIAYQNTNPSVNSPDKILNNPIVKSETSVVKVDSGTVKVSNHSDLIDQLVYNATENIGIRYRSGGTSKAGFDCSGLMYSTFGNFDIRLPRTSLEQSRIGIKVNSEEVQKGDLIFFKTNGRHQINHVGMVVEVTDEEIKFVHASTHGGVMISSTKEGYYQRNFTQVNRILE
ncbi:NlpC/P60 family protein [Flavobacterium piscis]|uniref:Cell wall-associated NlpC family hydrolase n=1 Tax=Flavobacterium piscis TaxID=1114874 RepID=A0ABU1YDJ6_9FLAO|nr:NlpC/P60 family protein [Flavobacterium piscis]MDR7212304.1 cell wall-associated NlpC family hydrolase [Flavobacterium piscis]